MEHKGFDQSAAVHRIPTFRQSTGEREEACCASTKSACPTSTMDPTACSTNGYVRLAANGCHCESDDDFRKCFAASCKNACGGTSYVMDYTQVPDFTTMVKLSSDGKIADFGCAAIASLIRTQEAAVPAGVQTPVATEKEPKRFEDQPPKEKGECCASTVRGCPISGPTACNIGGWVRSAAQGCYCPDELGPDMFRKCFAASCANRCDGPGFTIDYKKVPEWEEMEKYMETGDLKGVSCQEVIEFAPQYHGYKALK